MHKVCAQSVERLWKRPAKPWLFYTISTALRQTVVAISRFLNTIDTGLGKPYTQYADEFNGGSLDFYPLYTGPNTNNKIIYQ